MSDKLAIAFHGAAGTVTGSRHLVTAGKTRVLLDAGLFQGRKDLRLRNWDDPPFEPGLLHHVVLSHTHIDHVGYLPRLARLGLDSPVHMTPAAYDLAKLMLLDSAKIQEEDAERANRKGYSKHDPALPLYTMQDAWAALELRRAERYHTWFDLADEGSLRARYWNAGHILGSAFVELEARVAGRTVTIVFSGDIGRFDAPLHRDPEPLPACDVLIVESTYGDRSHSDVPIADQIAEPLRETLEAGGTVLVPAFAVGRSQIVSLLFEELMAAGKIPQVPIHVDSPMAVQATAIYDRFLDAKNVDDEHFANGGKHLLGRGIHLHETVSESKSLNGMKGPRIIISASGMLTGGRVLHHLRRLGPDRENLLLLVGYQPEGTRGRALLDGQRRVKVYGSHVDVRCRVLPVHGLSGHADREGLLRWVDSAPRPPAVAFCVHGDELPLQAMATSLRERGIDARVPSLDQEFDLLELLAARAPSPAVVTREPAAPAVPAAEPVAVPSPPEAPKPTTAPRERGRPLPVSQPQVPADDPAAADRIERILASPAYRRADEDLAFLKRDELRATRLQLEFQKTDLLMRQRGIEATIVVFGGTRIMARAEAERRVAAAERALGAAAEGTDERRLLELEAERARRILAKSGYYDVARELGRIVGRAHGGAADPRLLVVTGGGPGIMEAANRGAFDVGAPSIGLNITLPHEQFPNAYVTPELAFQFRYFALRKMHFLLRARALVAFPGGYGTLDELFDALCLVQTRKIDPLPIVLVGEDFWRGVLDAERLALEGTIDPEDVELFFYAETANDIWQGIATWYEQRGEPLFRPVDHAEQEECKDAGAAERARS